MAGDVNVLDAPPIPVPVVEEVRPRRGVRRPNMRSFAVTFFAVVLVAAFLSPLLRTVAISLKNGLPSRQSKIVMMPVWRRRRLRARGQATATSSSLRTHDGRDEHGHGRQPQWGDARRRGQGASVDAVLLDR